MVKNKGSDWFLIAGLILAIFFMNLPVAYTYFYHNITGMPKSINGSIDLSAINIGDGKIYLDGEWEFYWNRFIVSEPESLSKPDLIINVPDSWSNYKIDGSYLTTQGYGSYKLKLTNYEYSNSITLCVPDLGGAYRVFIDGQLVAKSGTVSKIIDKIFTVPKADLYPLVLSSDSAHEAVIEVATTRFSGLYMTPVLCDYNQIISANSNRSAVRFTLFGVAIFSFVSLIVMYIVAVRRKLHSFWLPIMIFCILIRIMLTTEFYSVWQPVLFFNLSYESTNEIMYFTTFVMKYLLIFLLQEQSGIKFNKREKIGFLAYYILLYLVYLLVPQRIYNHYLSVIIPMFTYVLDFYLFFKIYKGRQTMKKFGIVIFWGAILVIAGLTIDSYYINGKIFINMSLSLLLFFTVFALIMSFIYAMRSVDLYDDFTKSDSRLKLANSQLAMQKEYYSALSEQMGEIREIKHDIRHFIRTLGRLASEDRFDELKVFLEEYSEKTETEKLPVFCENVIANSIIGYYCLRAKESGITFKSRCDIVKADILSDSDLCIVLGNSLENAVHACKQIENGDLKFITVEVAKLKRQWLLKVKNSYSGIITIKDGRFISSKGENLHGLGISNIKKVIESYGGFVKIEYNENEFTLMAAVPEKNYTNFENI